jgi:ribonuclease HI
MKIERVIIGADGASRGNPGPAAIGATIKNEQGQVVARISRQIGIATNNQAEYQALIAALTEAIRLGARKVDISLDSELVVRQISGQYRVKNAALKPLLQEVKRLTGRLEAFTITHVPGKQNVAAHRLADMALRPPSSNNRPGFIG